MEDAKVKAPAALKAVTVIIIVLSVISFSLLGFFKTADAVSDGSQIRYIGSIGIVSCADIDGGGFYTDNDMLFVSAESSYNSGDMLVVDVIGDFKVARVSEADNDVLSIADSDGNETIYSAYDMVGKVNGSVKYIGYITKMMDGYLGYIIFGAIPLLLTALFIFITAMVKKSRKEKQLADIKEAQEFVPIPKRDTPFARLPEHEEAVSPPKVSTKTVTSVLHDRENKDVSGANVVIIKDGDTSGLSDEDIRLIEKINGTNAVFKKADDIIKGYREAQKREKEKEVITQSDEDIQAKLYYDNDIENYR